MIHVQLSYHVKDVVNAYCTDCTITLIPRL